MGEKERHEPAAQEPQTPCVFAKALLACFCTCHRARQYWVGESTGFRCLSPASATRCSSYLSTLRSGAEFVFGRIGPESCPTHSQLMRLQCGGLRGAAALRSRSDNGSGTIDVDRLLAELEFVYPDFEAMPLDRVVRDIAGYRPRHGRSAT